MNTNILDGSGSTDSSQTYNEYQTDTLSEETKKKIAKLTRDDAAQLTKNDNYWEKMRKADLNLYRSPKMSEERFQAAVRLGDKFYSENE
jgi:hypothetical protein